MNIGRRSIADATGPAASSSPAANQEPDTAKAYPDAPDFSLETPGTHAAVKLKDFAGSTVALLITTTTCPICRKQIDELKTIHKNYTDKGVKFINGVIPQMDDLGTRWIVEDEVLEYVAQSGLPFPAHMDKEDTLAESYGVETVPVLAFITPRGRLMLTRTFTYAKDVSKILDALIEGTRVDTSGMETLVG